MQMKQKQSLQAWGLGGRVTLGTKKQLDRKNRKNKSKQTNAKKVKESLQELGLGGRYKQSRIKKNSNKNANKQMPKKTELARMVIGGWVTPGTPSA